MHLDVEAGKRIGSCGQISILFSTVNSKIETRHIFLCSVSFEITVSKKFKTSTEMQALDAEDFVQLLVLHDSSNHYWGETSKHWVSNRPQDQCKETK